MTRPNEPPPSLLAQFGETRAAFLRLVHAHIALLRAEISAILDRVKSMAAGAAIALSFALIVGNMLYVGGFLFTGEWLFGSMGWGLAQGTLFGLGVVVTAILSILGVRSRTSVVAFLLAVVATVGLALLTGSNVAYDAASSLGGQLASPFNSTGLIAAIAGAIVVGIVFLLLLLVAAGVTGAVAGLIVGAIIGLLVGWLVAGAPWTWPPAVGFAITIGLLLWPILAVVLGWRQIDLEKRFGRLYPRQSIEAVNETRAWLEEQWRTRQPKLGRK